MGDTAKGASCNEETPESALRDIKTDSQVGSEQGEETYCNSRAVDVTSGKLGADEEVTKKLAERLLINDSQEKEEPNNVEGCMSKQCMKQLSPEVMELVQRYSRDRDWYALQDDLGAVLDHNSEEYKQLQDAWSVFCVGLRCYIQLATLLLNAGMSPDRGDDEHYNMLHGAARNGHLQIVKLLLEYGADVNMRDCFYNTAVMLASWEGHFEVVKQLVEAGADTAAKNDEDCTALDWAKIQGHTALIEYLEQFPH